MPSMKCPSKHTLLEIHPDFCGHFVLKNTGLPFWKNSQLTLSHIQYCYCWRTQNCWSCWPGPGPLRAWGIRDRGCPGCRWFLEARAAPLPRAWPCWGSDLGEQGNRGYKDHHWPISEPEVGQCCSRISWGRRLYNVRAWNRNLLVRSFLFSKRYIHPEIYLFASTGLRFSKQL